MIGVRCQRRLTQGPAVRLADRRHSLRRGMMAVTQNPTSGSERQCFVQLWPPWGMRSVSKTLPQVKPIIDLDEEVR